MNKIVLKKLYLSILLIPAIFLLACNRQPSSRAGDDNLGAIREEMLVVLDKINTALEANSTGDFKNKTSDAVADLDNHIEKYIDEMYNNERKITENSINRLMVIKQKKVEMEFKLDLLQKETRIISDQRNGLRHSDTVITIHNATGSAVNQQRRAEEERTMERDRRGDDIASDMGSDGPAARDVIDRPAADKTATDISITDTLVAPRISERPVLIEELHLELINDLHELRKELELFVQTDL
jgi:hypothetical protein